MRRKRASCRSFLHEILQPKEGLIPLLRHDIGVIAHQPQRRGIELKQAFASGAHAAHDAYAFEHAQMFRDRLPSELGAFRELCNRSRLAVAQSLDQCESSFIAERREDRRRRGFACGRVSFG